MAHNCHIKYKLLTSNTNCSRQIQIAHVKYKLLTSNTKSWHQIQITHIKNKLLTSNTKSWHQIQITHIKKKIAHIKYKLLTSKTNCSHQKQDLTVSGRRTKTMSSFHSVLTRPPFCSCTWYCRRVGMSCSNCGRNVDKCNFCSNCGKGKLMITSDDRQRQR